MQGGQVVIDSTGRAKDTLKRIWAHIPLDAEPSVPTDAIEAGQSVCKRIQTSPAQTTFDSPAGYSVNDCKLDNN